MKDAGMLAVVATISIAAAGCAQPRGIERDMLKALLDREAAASAGRLLGARYEPRDGRLLEPGEIREQLNARKAPVESLPPGLRSALERDRVVGLLASGMQRIAPSGSAGAVPKKLDAINAMLLAWEQELFGSGGGGGGGGGSFGGLWLDGQDGCSDLDPRCCPNHEMCVDFACTECSQGGGAGDSASKQFCICFGVRRCPPCRNACDRPCSSPPVASPPDR